MSRLRLDPLGPAVASVASVAAAAVREGNTSYLPVAHVYFACWINAESGPSVPFPWI